MEQKSDNKTIDMSYETDRKKCDAFIEREDIDDSLFAMWIGKDRNLNNAEVIVLFEDEFFAKIKGKERTTIHNEALAMDADYSFKKDYTISMAKKDINSISVNLPPLCNCDKEASPHQPTYYQLQVSTTGSDFNTIIHNREVVYMLYEHIRDWRFEKGIFRNTFKRKIKRFFRKLF